MSGPAGIPRWDEVQGKDDRLANRIISLMHSVRRISAGAFDALTTQLSLARYPIAEYKIKKLHFTALEPMHSLVVGFLAQIQAATSPVLNTAFRDVAYDTVPAVIPNGLAYPFTLLSPLDNSPQVCVVYEDTAAGNLDFGTYLNSNKSGILSSNVQLLAAAGWTTTIVPNLTKITNSMAYFRHFNLNSSASLRALTLSAAGAVVNTAVVNLTPTGAGYVNRAPMHDFSDGKYYWYFEYDDATNVLQICKALISSLATTPVVTKQEVTNFEGTIEAFFHAYGDKWVLIGAGLTGPAIRYISGTLVDGGAPAAADMDTGTAYQVNSIDLRGFVGAPLGHGEKVRVFGTTGEGTAGNGIATSVFDLSGTSLTVSTERILGVAENWPVATPALNPPTLRMSGYSNENGRLVQSVEVGFASLQLFVYSVVAGRQMVAMVPAHAALTELDTVSWVNCDGAPLVAAARTAGGTHLLELSS